MKTFLLIISVALACLPMLAQQQEKEPVAWLAKPSLEVCLTASDAGQAAKFFAEGLGLTARGEPQGVAATGGLRMLLFAAGNLTVKVRVYTQSPAAR